MSLQEDTTSSKEGMLIRNKALEYCDGLIEYYKRSRILNRKFSKYSQIITLFFAGITPIVVLFGEVPDNIKAIPPVIASMSASLTIFKWHESWIACKNTEEALEFEKLIFQLKATRQYQNVKDEDAISVFLEKVHMLHQAHLGDWTELMAKGLEDKKIENYKTSSDLKMENLIKSVKD